MLRRPTPSALAALAVAFALAAVARGEIEFNGILVTQQRTLFALLDPETGESGWRATGEAFSGFVIGRYDPRDDSLALTKDGATSRLRLKDAKVRPARFTIAGTFTLGEGEQVEVRRATLAADQETVFPLRDGLACRVTVEQQPDGTLRYRMTFERRLAENKTERITAPAVTALPGHAFKVQVDDLGFAFSPHAP